MRSIKTPKDIYTASRAGAAGGLAFGLFQCTNPASFDVKKLFLLSISVTIGMVGLPLLLVLKDALFEEEPKFECALRNR